MINYGIIKTATLEKYPFEIAKFENLIPADLMERLRVEYPKDNFYMYERKMGHDKTYKQCGRHFIIPGENKPHIPERLSDTWLELADDLLSRQYREAVETLMNRPLDDAYLGVDFWRFDPGSGCYIAPHADVPWKIATHLFYFIKEWNPNWGGVLSYHDCDKENDIVKKYVPSMQISPFLVRSDRSFHSIQPVDDMAPESRKILDIVFYNELPPAPRPGRLSSNLLSEEILSD